MKRLLITLLLLTVFVPSTQAAFVDVSLSHETVEVRSGEYFIIDVTLKNHGDEDTNYVLSIKSNRPWWYVPGNLLTPVEAKQEKTITQGFYPTSATPGTYPFTLNFRIPNTDPVVMAEKSFDLVILPDVFPTTVSAESDGTSVKVMAEVNSWNERTIEVYYEFLDENGWLITSFSSMETVSGISTFEVSSGFPMTPPGIYTARITIDGQSLETPLVNPAVHRLEQSKEEVLTFGGVTTTYTIRNEGNVDETFTTQETFASGDLITGHLTASTSCTDSNGERDCAYSVFVASGATGQIIYTLEFWPTYLITIIVGIVIAGAGLRVSRTFGHPRITKKYSRRGKNLSVVIGVKNAYRTTRSVIVRDWVSPLARVVMEEFEAVRPVVKRSDAGTQLVWALGDMKPREERLLSYKIRPIVRGNLKMSKATVRFKDKGQIKRRQSKHISIR